MDLGGFSSHGKRHLVDSWPRLDTTRSSTFTTDMEISENRSIYLECAQGLAGIKMVLFSPLSMTDPHWYMSGMRILAGYSTWTQDYETHSPSWLGLGQLPFLLLALLRETS